MLEKIETIEEAVTRIHEDLKSISKETGIKTKELMSLMANRELVIINNQLCAIHEHLEKIEEIITSNKCCPANSSKKEVT